MHDEFQKLIYSSFKSEIIPNVDLKNIALMITFLYNISIPMSEKIVFDYDTENNGKLNKNQYENIMSQFFIVDKSVLKNRVEVFKSCDSNNDGSINIKELRNLHVYMQNYLISTNQKCELYDVDYVMETFSMKGDGKLNFLDVNKYMNELNINFTE